MNPASASAPLSQRAALTVFTLLVRAALPFVAKVEVSPTEARSTPGRGTLVVLNHRSMLDFPVGAVACRRWGMWPCALGRADFFDRRLAGRALRLLGAIPAGVRHSPAATLDGAGAVLRAGGVVAIAPEGRIVVPEQRPGGLGRFRSGVGVLVSRCEPRVLLVALTDADVAWPPGRSAPVLHLPWNRPTVNVSAAWLEVPKGTPPAEATVLVADGLTTLLATRPPSSSR